MSERIVIVTGSRRWPSYLPVWAVLDAHAPTLVVHGACIGVDGMAESWCKGREVDYHGMPARWTGQTRDRSRLDRGAGHARNRRMLLAYPGALVLAFPLGASPGTRGCIRMALEHSHPVKVFDLDGNLVPIDLVLV
jgi:hypothetical protein